jgi:hypothetical protein
VQESPEWHRDRLALSLFIYLPYTELFLSLFIYLPYTELFTTTFESGVPIETGLSIKPEETQSGTPNCGSSFA